ncbi:uncharacterized protein LOC122540698 isoform X2 [Chiloscyllium plagiosum]|uniref:uncharacterized protein LOC122540698 isoform X2 n=1 Tax=Chiloscyllium plagiosum TaxID=36176 RepID=UPI001CB81F65|nr:uncharacterized protein LOC122540698 isoform X2 [Chiloscyllium plagiosum]
MFITVLYGDNEHALFNIFCKIPVLLDCIKQNCHREIKAEIDLADESGQVKNLLQNQHCYASDILAERAVYILLGVNTKLGARLDSLSQPQGKVKKIHKNSASPSPSRSSTTDGKQNTSPHGKCKNTSTP